MTATIFLARYYAQEISMHSYDNGTALRAKKDNWAQLLKVFRKLGLAPQISEEEVGRVLRCEEDAAVGFISKLYEILTQRKVQVNIKPPTIGRTAGYAKETGAWKVKEALRKSDITATGDDNAIKGYTSQVVNSHEKSLQDDRSIDPDRYNPSSSIAPRNAPPRSTGPDDSGEMPQVRVKEIQVKQLDRNVTHLRASKHNFGGGGSVSPSVGGARGSTPGGGGFEPNSSVAPHVATADHYGQQSIGRGMAAENSSSLLNTCISRVLNQDNVPRWHSSLEPIQNLLSMLDHLRMGGNSADSLVSAAVREIQSSAAELAESCAVTPKQFWKVSDLFVNLLVAAPQNSKAYSTVVECFSHIGYTIAQRDPRSSLSLFCDFSLFKLVPTLQSHPRKRLGILQVLLAFSPPDSHSHVQSIKKLQDALSGGSGGTTLSEAASQMLPVFISCLTILATLETCLDAVLLDLYLYYSSIALGMPSPRVRAGGIGVLATLYGRARDSVSQMLPQLYSISATEKWWEVHVYLLSLCARILESEMEAPGSTPPETCSGALEIIEALFKKKAPKNIKLWGVAVLAKAMAYNSALTHLYLSILIDLTPSDRRYFLDLSKESDARRYGYRVLELPSSSGIPFSLDTISMRWDHTVVAKAVVTLTKESGSDRLGAAEFEIFYSSFQSEVISAKSAAGYPHSADEDNGVWLNEVWVDIFDSMLDLVFVGLCDANCAEIAASTLLFVLQNSAGGCNIIKGKRFTGVLRLVYPADRQCDLKCQNVLQSFLRQVFDVDDECAGTVIGVIENFANNYTVNFEVSNLQSLLKELSSLM